MSEIPFDPLTTIRVLLAHRVRFVLIGGYAASLRGSPVITGDLDLCYARDRDNLERLAGALQELGARLRGPNVPDELPFRADADTLEGGDHFTFQTRTGSLDIIGTPAGTAGFKDLEAAATETTIDGMTVTTTASMSSSPVWRYTTSQDVPAGSKRLTKRCGCCVPEVG